MSRWRRCFFLVDGHLDRKLCRSVFHDPKLLQDRVPEYCHPHCRGAGLSVPGKAIELFTISICIANTAIMLLTFPAATVLQPASSLSLHCLITFGDADGCAAAGDSRPDLCVRADDLVLCRFAPRTTRQEKRKRWLYLLLCCWFFLVGMKRIAIPAVVLFVLIALLLRKRKVPRLVLPGSGRLLHPVFFWHSSTVCATVLFQKLLNSFWH